MRCVATLSAHSVIVRLEAGNRPEISSNLTRGSLRAHAQLLSERGLMVALGDCMGCVHYDLAVSQGTRLSTVTQLRAGEKHITPIAARRQD